MQQRMAGLTARWDTARAWVRRWQRGRALRNTGGGRQLSAALLGLVLVFTAAFAGSLLYLRPSSPGRELTLDQLSALVDQNRVVSSVFREQDARLEGYYQTAPVNAGGGAQPGTAGQQAYWVSYPENDSATAVLLQTLSRSGARIAVDPQTAKASVRLMATFLFPLLILASLFAFLFTLGRGGGAGIGEVMTFGTIGGRRLRRGQRAPITFADAAGADDAVEELREVRDYLADPRRYQDIGALPPKGVLLVGPPGCGKTLLAKAVAGEVGVPFFSVAGAEFVESLVGIGAARIRDLFRRVRAAAPAIVFIDELDAAGRKRAIGGGAGGTDEREQTLNQLLVEMDGFEVSAGIVVMGATNRPDILDPALLRPGRFDRHITIDRPEFTGRVRILELHARNKPVSPSVDFNYLARRTPGFSGADLSNVLNEAALLTVRAGKVEIETTDLEEAVHRVMSGTARRGRMLGPEERKRAAYHESGHVVAAAAAGSASDIHRVSILGRGRAVAGTRMRGASEAAVLTRRQLAGRLVVTMAGIAAEEMIFGDPSTGAERDLEEATTLARDLAGRYGMSARLGRSRLLVHDVDEFLEGEVALGPVSGHVHQEFDLEVRTLLEEAEREATRVLGVHRETLDRLAARLEAEETLEGPELEGVLALVSPEVELFGGLVSPSANGRGEEVPIES